ncbi:MAG: PH domain-containing protein [Aequorivita sp.]
MKVITAGGILILILVSISTIFIRQNYGLTTGVILGIIVLGTFFYFYANSLNEVIIEDKTIILKKNIGKIVIKFSEIESAKNVSSSALTMTTGSKGFFGFNGSAMDGSVSLVKDRSQMIQLITTSNKKYLISCDNPKALVDSIFILNHS